MNFIKRMFAKKPLEKWSLVETICLKNKIYTGDVKPSASECEHLYIYLFESELGKRRFTLHCNKPSGFEGDAGTLRLALYNYFSGSEIYRQRIKRWLLGRRDPKIPTYNQVADVEHIELLQGFVNPALAECDFKEEEIIQ